MIYWFTYLMIGTILALILHKVGMPQEVCRRADSLGMDVDPNLAAFSTAFSALFLWPILIAAYISNGFRWIK